MSGKIVLLSGHVCTGKTSLARELERLYGVRQVKTRELMQQLRPGVEVSREAMQREGERLDRQTQGRWVRDGLAKLLRGEPDSHARTYVVDAVRIRRQIEAVRQSYGRRAIHIHLKAPRQELARRYAARRHEGAFQEFASYDEVLANKTESRVDSLEAVADVVIDSKRCILQDVVTRVACHIGLYGRETERLVDVLVGGQYGSEGKGQVAAHLAPEYAVLVRVGGPNAGHTVFHDGSKAVFHHLPSGTVKCNARLLIGPGAVISVQKLLQEVAQYGVECDRLSIDPKAMTISDRDVRGEAGLRQRIASTGQGVGLATARKISDRGKPSVKLARDLRVLRPFVRETCEQLDVAFRQGQRVFLEGTQGTGLSLHHGWYPHVTSRDTSVAGCLAEAGVSPSRVRKVVVVCRTYPIRVADPAGKGKTSGRLEEISWEEVSRRCGIPVAELAQAERTTTTRRARRVGEFDWTLLRRAASLNAPTDIALTFVDYLDGGNRKAVRFEQLSPETIRFIQEVERVAAAPVSLISNRFGSVLDRRSW